MHTLSKQEAKNEIRKLIELYSSRRHDFDKQSEADVRRKLIDKVFSALGWDLEGNEAPDEVQREETISGKESSKKKADYVFRLYGVPKFVVEAKALKVELDNDEYRKQAIGYSYNLACSWAVLTNFAKMVIYFIDRDDNTVIRSIDDISNIENYDNNFEKLWLLSKEGVKNELLEKDLDQRGIKPKRQKVGKQLLEDLKTWRSLLSKEIKRRYGDKYQPYETDEIVQRIIDRLIFIRKLEDLGLEERKLDQISRKFNEGTTYKWLKTIFRYYRDKYNSGLFGDEKEQECDAIDMPDEIIEEVIRGMYKPGDREIEYNFAVIDADVLGSIYEEYLSYILKETPKRSKLEGGRAHKKEQGIYYTPTYIVEYIVKNTVTEQMKDKTIDEILDMRILDPACGSGSFLIKAFAEVCKIVEDKMKKGAKSNKWKTFSSYNGRLSLTQKVTILTKCIYGVDLDGKAVEIAQLNLFLKLLESETSETLQALSISGLRETKKILPMLNNNIKCGNSLIDDQLIAGDKAFKWNTNFPDVMAQDGFDVVLGNPPYVFGGNFGIKQQEKEFFKKSYASAKGKLNLFSLFIEKSINLLDDKGKMAFILPNTLLRVTSYEDTRKFILDRTKMEQIVTLEAGVFEGVTASTVIIVLEKESKKTDIENNQVKIFDGIQSKFSEKPQKEFLNELHIFDTGSIKEDNSIIEKMHYESVNLGTICKEMIFGVVITKNKDDVVSNKKINDKYKKFLEGRDIDRYRINFSNKYLLYEKSKLHRSRTPEIFEAEEKILVQRISGGKQPLKAAYDNEQFYDKESINNIILSNKAFSPKYILALLNSRLVNWFYSTKFTNASTLTVNVSKAYLSNIPVKNISTAEQRLIVELVDRILLLNRKLNILADKKTSEKEGVDAEIQDVEEKINQEIYKIYDITKQEKDAIEESLK